MVHRSVRGGEKSEWPIADGKRARVHEAGWYSRSSNQINQKNQTDKVSQIDQMDQLPATRREIFPGTFSSSGASVWMAQVMPRPVRKKLMSPVDTFGEEA